MNTTERNRMRRYMTAYRAAGRDKSAKNYRYAARLSPPPPVRRPLPPDELRDGHCVFCGLVSPTAACGVCVQELAA